MIFTQIKLQNILSGGREEENLDHITVYDYKFGEDYDEENYMKEYL